MSDLVQRLRDSVKACRALDRSALLAEAADEIERLRLQPCPYVTGKTTLHCTLTPFTLTDAERDVIEWCQQSCSRARTPQGDRLAATLRGLLERTK